MPYELLTSRKEGHIHLKATGENTPENLVGYLSEGIRKAVETKCPYVLVEQHLIGPELELVEITAILDQLRFAVIQHISAVAFVNTNPEHSDAYTRFAENFATNRNINTRIFHTVAEAEDWLRFERSTSEQPDSS